jgi:molybdenum cofactor cytidylyltransferase
VTGDERSPRECPGVAALILAAGRATRMGSTKVLLPLGGRPMVRRVVDAALASQAAPTVVVVGADAAAVTRALEGMPVAVVVNPDYDEGMSTSLRAGLAALGPEVAGALILLGDQPFVTAALLDTLIDRFATCGKAVVRPSVGGRPANPVLVAAALFPELAAERGDVGGRHVIARRAADVCLVPVADPHELTDIDSPQDYEKEKDA